MSAENPVVGTKSDMYLPFRKARILIRSYCDKNTTYLGAFWIWVVPDLFANNYPDNFFDGLRVNIRWECFPSELALSDFVSKLLSK